MGSELVKQEAPQSFIERLIEHAEDLEKIKEVGMVIINSGFCPEHFKQSKDAVGAIMCIEAGRKLGLTWMQSLSDIYPVKGRIGIMGSAARAVIFSSGILDKWEEVTEGEYPNDTYKHIIISKRKGLPGEFKSEFSVYDAKKAGLFGKDIYQRYGKRMIMWRNIGFHANDYYGDIMKGMKTVEELSDFDVIPGIGDTTIEKEDGTKINITAGAKHKSEKATSRVADKIPDSKFGNVNQNISDAIEVKEEIRSAPITQTVMQTTVKNESHPPDESPFIASKGSVEFMNGVTVKRDDTGNITNQDEIDKGIPEGGGELTLAGMEKMETKDLLEIVNADMDMIEAMTVLPGKNTNKKIREIIFAHQNGRLTEYVAELLPKPEVPPIENNASNPPENVSAGEIPTNKDFDKQPKELFPGELERAKATEGANKYGIPIPDFDKGESRDFATMKSLFNGLVSVNPPVNNPRYLELAGKMGILAAFPDRETFCKNATVKMINELLDTN